MTISGKGAEVNRPAAICHSFTKYRDSMSVSTDRACSDSAYCRVSKGFFRPPELVSVLAGRLHLYYRKGINNSNWLIHRQLPGILLPEGFNPQRLLIKGDAVC